MRRQTGNFILAVSALSCFALSTVIPNSTAVAKDAKAPPAPTKAIKATKTKVAGRAVMEPKEFDRLDGHGPSGKKVDVIEWENNLEVHVYPKGALKSLGMKIDHTQKDKPVMVIEYGFNGVAYTLIRRAILGIPLKDGFKTFQDTGTDDYDKVIVSNNTLSDGVRPFALAPAPTQLYPDYHPALQAQDTGTPSLGSTDEPAKTYQRKNASEGGATMEPSTPGVRLENANQFERDSHGTSRRRNPDNDNSDGEVRIRNFAF